MVRVYYKQKEVTNYLELNDEFTSQFLNLISKKIISFKLDDCGNFIVSRETYKILNHLVINGLYIY